MLHATIKNFSYKKYLKEELKTCDFTDINALPSKCLTNFNDRTFALSKWVSPKRTRSYPYARVYDTFSSSASKITTIIPLIKDEGINGDIDYLQWDTISFMSLLNVYVILAYYDKAESHPHKSDKITNQQFNNNYIKQQLHKLSNYHQSALHWNLNQLERDNLSKLIDLVKTSYNDIAKELKCTLHNHKNIDTFATKISQTKESFMQFSRTKAQMAQNRESLTIQPKEQIGIGQKSRIIIENYLGGQYFFTIDDVLLHNNTFYLCESKHSKSALLPSSDDIKDGLLKLMLYNNIDSLQGHTNFTVVLRLTSSILQSGIKLPNNNIESFLQNNAFTKTQNKLLQDLNAEAKANNFAVWINNDV